MFAVRLRWFPVGVGRIFNDSLTFTSIVRDSFSNSSKVYSSRNDRSIKFRLHIISTCKGNSSLRVLFGHALRNALIPIITIIVPMLASILTGTLTIENIFEYQVLGTNSLDRLQPMISQLSWLQQYYLVHYLLFQSLL